MTFYSATSFKPQECTWTCQHFRRNLANLFTEIPSTPFTRPSNSEPLATHRNHASEMRQACIGTGHLALGGDLHLQKQGLFHSRLGKADTQRMGFRPKKREQSGFLGPWLGCLSLGLSWQWDLTPLSDSELLQQWWGRGTVNAASRGPGSRVSEPL